MTDNNNSRIGNSIREAQAKKEKQQQQKEKELRIQLAKQGRTAYEAKNHVDAIAIYQRFLEITARSRNVDIDALHPKLFPEAERIAESLLIASICFDMAKMYDQVDNAGRERSTYLRLVVMFSHGMKFQKMMADNLVKFVAYTAGIRHPDEFKAAGKTLEKDGRCFIATVAFESPAAREVQCLREFRDAYLVTNSLGRYVTESYYFISPPIAQLLDKSSLLRIGTRALLRVLILMLPNHRSESI